MKQIKIFDLVGKYPSSMEQEINEFISKIKTNTNIVQIIPRENYILIQVDL